MVFNSIEFAIFLPIVFAIYWLINGLNLKWQNAFLLVASYFFYGWWDWRFLILIAISSLVDFTVGINMSSSSYKKGLLWISLVVNLGLLGYFKYYNFFVDSFSQAFTLLGHPISPDRLNIILPVGISFYTFQTLSYTIDIYKGRIKASRSLLDFFAYVSFFPQLVAGPIERAFDLLPQFEKKRSFNYDKAVDGMRQIMWGMFKKVVIADNCAPYVQDIFSDSQNLHSPMLLVGMILFMAQLYCDFSGYSDIAIGTARLFGFSLSKNFNFPQYSKSIPEFWSRWHITMTSWFRDYVYMPLIRWRRKGIFKFVNIIVLFLVIGFWHGAKWNFIFFGLINAVVYIAQNAWAKRNFLRPSFKDGSYASKAHLLSRIFSNYFILIVITVFFRAESINHAFNYLLRCFNPENWFIFDIIDGRLLSMRVVFTISMIFLIYEYFQQNSEHALEMKNKIFRISWFRWFLYVFFIVTIYYYRGVELDFIYFQF